jgi:hypothetical protein
MAFVAIGLQPETRGAISALERAAAAAGFRMILTSGFRDKAKQLELVRSGRAITPALPGRSTHNYGLAFDAVAPGHQEELGQLAERLGLFWGGRFRTPDPVHFQLVTFADWAWAIQEFRL